MLCVFSKHIASRELRFGALWGTAFESAAEQWLQLRLYFSVTNTYRES